jgi:hypothetical protein
MSLTLADKQTLNSLSDLFYSFLPASFNNNTSFPIAAQRAGVSECWELSGSKGPTIAVESARATSIPVLCTRYPDRGIGNGLSRQEG